MTISLHGRSLLSLFDVSVAEIGYLLALAIDLKIKRRSGQVSNTLAGKSIVLVFNKPSTRTHCAFETAIFSEGGQVTFLANSHLGHKESLEDTAKVLGRYYDGIGFRGYDHCDVECLAKHAGIPVWNGLTDQHHPTQILADLMTMQEYVNKPLCKIKCVYVGDGRNNVATSLMIAAAKMGMHFINLAPKSLWPAEDFLESIRGLAMFSQATIACDDDIDRAVKNADVLYTDVWVSMGEESEWSKRIDLLKDYQVSKAMLTKTENKNVIFMHCLPAFHDTETEVGQEIKKQFGLECMEVSDEVFRSKHSVVFEQAENRLYTLKSLILATIGNT